MCFFNRPQPAAAQPTVVTKTVVQQQSQPAARPERDPKAGLSQLARMRVLKARGIKDAIASSPLGDPNFGAAVRKPTLLGATSAT